MTNDDAIEEIKSWTPTLLQMGDKCTNKTVEAQKMAIQALEQMKELNLLLIQDDAHLMSVHHIKEKLGLLEVEE